MPPEPEEGSTGGLHAGAAGAPTTFGSTSPLEEKVNDWCGLLRTSSLKEGAV
jgi:hypothetical protein